MAVAIATKRASGSDELRVWTRDARRGALTAHRILRGPLGPFALAFNDRGDLLVVGSRARQISSTSDAAVYTFWSRLVPRAGAAGRAQRVARVRSARSESEMPVHAALAADRSGLVGWDLLPCGAGGGCGPSALGFAASRPGAKAWRSQRLGTLAGGEYLVPTRVLVAAGRRQSQVVWGASTAGGIEIRAATVRARRLERVHRVSPVGVDARPAALAMNPSGATTVIWTQRTTIPGPSIEVRAELFAASRTPHTPFRASGRIWDRPVRLGATVALLSDRVTGRAEAAWQEPNGGPFIYAHD